MAELAETVRIEVAKELGRTLTGETLMPATGPVGDIVAVILTNPPNPPTESTVIVAEFDKPARTVSEEVG